LACTLRFDPFGDPIGGSATSPCMTEGEYDAAAQSWASATAGVSKPIQFADGSWGPKWQTPGGGPGGIVDADGNIITYWTK
jgi:hypothetical protein